MDTTQTPQTPQSSQTSPLLTRDADAEKISDAPGSLITLLADQPGLTCNTAEFEAGAAGAPVHFHTRATEFFFVIDGSLDVLVDDEIVALGKGDFLAVPPGTKHAFAPTAGSTAQVLVGFTPGMERFDYYRLLGRVSAGEATVQDIKDSSPVYDNHYAESTVWSSRTR